MTKGYQRIPSVEVRVLFRPNSFKACAASRQHGAQGCTQAKGRQLEARKRTKTCQDHSTPNMREADWPTLPSTSGINFSMDVLMPSWVACNSLRISSILYCHCNFQFHVNISYVFIPLSVYRFSHGSVLQNAATRHRQNRGLLVTAFGRQRCRQSSFAVLRVLATSRRSQKTISGGLGNDRKLTHFHRLSPRMYDDHWWPMRVHDLWPTLIIKSHQFSQNKSSLFNIFHQSFLRKAAVSSHLEPRCATAAAIFAVVLLACAINRPTIQRHPMTSKVRGATGRVPSALWSKLVMKYDDWKILSDVSGIIYKYLQYHIITKSGSNMSKESNLHQISKPNARLAGSWLSRISR